METNASHSSVMWRSRLSVPEFKTESTKLLALLTRQPAPVAYPRVKGASAESREAPDSLIHKPKCVNGMKPH